MHRQQAEQIGFDRERIRICKVSVGRIRHRRIQPRAVAANAAMQRVQEILIAVIADAGVFVRREVGRIQRAERQPDSEAAGIILAARRRVANHAIRRFRQIFAPLDLARLGERGRHPRGISRLVVSERHLWPFRKGQRPRTSNDPASNRCCNRDDCNSAKEDA